MRALTLALALTASAVCGPAAATTFLFNFDLSGAAEAPPNASTGTGTGTVTLDDVLHRLTIDVTFQGLTSTTTAAHIHAPTAQPFTGTAGVATELPSFTGFPLGVQSGTYSHVFDTSLTSTYSPTFLANSGGTAAGAEAALLEAARHGRAYFNIHSTAFPGGEIRGFLNVVPEPGAWALMILGFGLTGAVIRARRRAEVKVCA